MIDWVNYSAVWGPLLAFEMSLANKYTAGINPEEAEILKSEISDEDLSYIELGAVFYWNIGYHVDSSGQRRRASVIRFRRLPVWKED